ncbi:MAG: thioesterase family protein [Phenylobacterium sp.]
MSESPGTPFRQLLESLEPGDGGLGIDLPGDWLQGRTAYGGLTGALCVEAARRLNPDLPPLRNAHFALAGPATGRLTVTAGVVRRGKSAVVIEASVTGEAGPAARALLTYGTGRESRVVRDGDAAPAVPSPQDCPAFFDPDRAPGFARHFDVRLAAGARPPTPGAEPPPASGSAMVMARRPGACPPSWPWRTPFPRPPLCCFRSSPLSAP